MGKRSVGMSVGAEAGRDFWRIGGLMRHVAAGDPARGAERRHFQIQFVIVAAALLGLLSLWSGCAALIASEQDHVRRAARDQMIDTAQAFAENAESILATMDQVTLLLKRSAETGMDPTALKSFLQSEKAFGGIVLQAAFVGKDGSTVVEVGPDLVRRFDLSDREHFTFHVARDTGAMYVSRPLIGRVIGRRSVNVSRRINAPDGSFGGIVSVALDPKVFAKYHEFVRNDRSVILSLVGRDGIFRAHYPTIETVADIVLSPDDVLMRAAAAASSGSYARDSLTDGIPRIFGFRALRNYPFVAVAGASEADLLRDFHRLRDEKRRETMLISAFVVALASMLMLLVFKQHQNSARLVAAASATEASLRDARRANMAKTEFLMNMSHELRTPLNAIIGYSEMIEGQVVGQILPRYTEYGRSIGTAGRHLLSIVTEILDMIEVESGSYMPNCETFDLGNEAATIVGIWSVAAKDAGVDLQSVRSGEALPICADMRSVSQAIVKIVDNAIKYTPKGGRVVVSDGRTAHGCAFVSIKDTGTGIKPRCLEKIFEPFWQAGSALTRNPSGTGLGLPLSKRFVELNQGRIEIASTPGVGTEITIRFPRAGAASVPGACERLEPLVA